MIGLKLNYSTFLDSRGLQIKLSILDFKQLLIAFSGSTFLPLVQSWLTEVLKQPQHAPLPIEKQILVIYPAVNAFCDRMHAISRKYYARIYTNSK
ncbi:ATP synthase subunit alpha, mitochondrial [Glycine soja]|uniref:ATP synthase subunit alpha, mitochondrial n=1 Tax=Glycine soja TaxID=3848 RepID=A0A445HMH1_GLYSO|nr:ATP synthase subunit alpha, mitochondrial [Glycine soja]